MFSCFDSPFILALDYIIATSIPMLFYCHFVANSTFKPFSICHFVFN